jgi:hypothetical protein
MTTRAIGPPAPVALDTSWPVTDWSGLTTIVDAIVEAQQVGNEFVRGRVEAGEPGFVAMWDERGGAEWFDGVTVWMECQRDLWLEALRT